MNAISQRHTMRILFDAALIVVLPLTGFILALPTGSTNTGVAVILTLISIGVGIGAEFMASSNELEMLQLSKQLDADRLRRREELALRDEKLREFDRVIHLLTEQDQNLRGLLIEADVDVQRTREEQATIAATEEKLPKRSNAFAFRRL